MGGDRGSVGSFGLPAPGTSCVRRSIAKSTPPSGGVEFRPEGVVAIVNVTSKPAPFSSRLQFRESAWEALRTPALALVLSNENVPVLVEAGCPWGCRNTRRGGWTPRRGEVG